MRIALKVGSSYYPLAGEAGVSERDHTSAADFQLSAQAEKQIIPRVRASHVQIVDRGNLMHTVRFTTARQFATPAAAFLAVIDHDAAMPRAGVLVLDAVAPDGGIYRRLMASAVVTPPARRVIGATALYDYSVDGGAIADGGYFAAGVDVNIRVTGVTTPSGHGSIDLELEGEVEGTTFWRSAGLEWAIFREAGEYTIYRISGEVTSYWATKTSAALSPVGLTGWTITTGAGQPVIAALP